MNELERCYGKMQHILGNGIDPLESVRLVEQYRQFWKPEKVKVVLLAESHVFTTDEDRKISIPPIAGLTGYPREYAKFVYCIGYGESGLTKHPAHPKRDGTPQFWKMFLSCNTPVNNNSDFAPILKSKTPLGERISNKIQLLMTLKEKGVWLIDASICALYANGKKPSYPVILDAIRTSWLNYTKNQVEAAHPDHVIIIGKGVSQVLETEVRKITNGNYSIVDAPNAHLSSEEHFENYKTYCRLCNK